MTPCDRSKRQAERTAKSGRPDGGRGAHRAPAAGPPAHGRLPGRHRLRAHRCWFVSAAVLLALAALLPIPALAQEPVVSISSTVTKINEGGRFPWTLSRTGATTSSLTVKTTLLLIDDYNDESASSSRPSVIPMGSSSLDLALAFVPSNQKPDPGRVLSVTIEDTDDYAVDAEAGSVEVTLFNTNPGLLLSKLSLTVEERTMATYTVRLATAPSGSVVVTPSVPQGASFSVTPASRSFGSASWSTSQTFTVTPAADPDTNDEAAVSVTHSVSTSYLFSALQTATAVPSISVTVEDDGLATVTIAADASPVTEGVEAVFTVSLSDDAASALPVMVTATQSGSFATNALPNSLTIAAGDTMAGLTIATQDDAVTEANGSVTITIAPNAAYVVGSPSSATVAITDNDTPPSTLSLSGDVTRTEATENLEFTVTISRTPAVDVTVDWATADGSAASGSDYTEADGTVTFAAGASALAKSFTVTIREDSLDEPEEQFTVALSNAAGASIAASADTATVTITDDDVPALSIPEYVHGTEGVAGGMMNFPVTLSLASALEITVDYATADGTGVGAVPPATAPSDYLAATGTLSFAPGDTTRTIAVELVDDPDHESRRESFTVALSNPSATAVLGTAKVATGVIQDNDGLPTLSITDASAAEGAGEIVFAVALTGRNLDPISATWSTADGTATAPADYTAVTAGTVRIPAGERSASLTVQLAADDDVPGSDKQFTVTLADPDPSDVPLGTATATGTIVDDEMTTVTVAKGTDVTEGTAAQFTLSRIGDLTESLVVSIAVTQDGLVLTSAPPPVSATFAKGSTQVEVSVPTDDDDLDEASGSITVTVTDGDTYDLRDPAAATVAVADNDLPVVTIRSTTTSITEGGSFPFEVSRVGDTTAALAVRVAVSATNDYTTSPRPDLTVAIAAGSSSAAASVTVVDNAVSRGNGSLNLLLFRDLARYRSGSPNSVSATIMDNDAAGVPVLNGGELGVPRD